MIGAEYIKIAVVGSLNMDYSVMLKKRPAVGETVLADGILITPGGKGGESGLCRREDRGECPDDWQSGRGCQW